MIDFSTYLSCDLRSLALARVSLAGVAFLEFIRYRDLATNAYTLSMHTLLDNDWYRHTFDVVAIACLVLLAVGYQTRLAAIISWLFLTSLYGGNSFIDSDRLLISLLLLGSILPLGSNFSIDAAMNGENGPRDSVRILAVEDNNVKTVPTAALTLYVAIGLLVSLSSGFFLDVVFGFDVYVFTVIGLAVVISLLVPLPSAWIRTSVISMFMLVLLSDRFLDGVSRPSLNVALLALLPAPLWDKFARASVFSKRHKLRIFFDEPCGFCRKTCLLFRTFMLLGDARIMPAQIDPAAYEIMQRYDSWVVYDHDNKHYVRWRAVLLLMRRSPLLWPLGLLLTALGMGHWGEAIYKIIARSRTRLSKISSILMPYRHQRIVATPLEDWLASVWLFSALVGIGLINGGDYTLTTPESVLRYLGFGRW